MICPTSSYPLYIRNAQENIDQTRRWGNITEEGTLSLTHEFFINLQNTTKKSITRSKVWAKNLKCLDTYDFENKNVSCLAVGGRELIVGDTFGKIHRCLDWSKSLDKWKKIEVEIGSTETLACKEGLVVGGGNSGGSSNLWDIQLSTNNLRYLKYFDRLHAVAIHDQSYLCGGEHLLVKLEIESGKYVTTFPYIGSISALAFKGDILATASKSVFGLKMCLWDLRSTNSISSFPSDEVNSLALDNQTLVSGHLLSRKFEIRDLRAINKPLFFISISDDLPVGKYVALNGDVFMGTVGKTVRVYDIKQRERLAILVGHPHPITGMAFQDNQIFSVSNNAVKLWGGSKNYGRL